jgi:hypothetical protein
MRDLSITAMVLALFVVPYVSESAHPQVSSAIDQFVSQLYPKGSHYFWVINDTTSEVSHKIIMDINAALQVNSKEDPQLHRFLLLLVNRKIIGTQRISLDANVDCHSDEKAI